MVFGLFLPVNIKEKRKYNIPSKNKIN